MAIRYLIVEDEPTWQGLLKERLINIPDAEVEDCNRMVDAIAMAQARHFDIAFVDMYLRESIEKGKRVPEGIDVVERLGKVSPATVVIAYSTDIEQHQESQHPLYSQCITLGATVVLSRAEFMNWGSKVLETETQKWLSMKKSSRSTLASAPDLLTKAAIETIGEETLLLILRDLLPNAADYAVRALKGGFSGAILFSVKATTLEGDHLDTVLKASRSTTALERELKRRPQVGSQFDALAVAPMSHSISKKVGEWIGALMREIVNARPLATVVSEQTITAATKKAIDRAVAQSYVAPMSHSMVANSDPYELSWRAAAALDRSLSDLQNMKAIVSSADRVKCIWLKKFLREVMEGKKQILVGGARTAHLHGDLHADNVFLGDNSGPYVIDFEHHDLYPRLFDCAALHVDLILVRLDQDGGRNWDISHIDAWERWASNSFPFSDGDGKGKKSSPTAINYVRDALVKAVRGADSVAAEEYGRSLMFQLARYLKFETITIPKKVLGLRLFCKLAEAFGLKEKTGANRVKTRRSPSRSTRNSPRKTTRGKRR